MKKIFYAFTMSSLFMFASCSKGYDANNEDAAYGTKTIEYSIIADAPGYGASATKADLGAVARVYWKEGDKVNVYKANNLNNCLGRLTATTPTDNYSKTTFSGTIEAPQEGEDLFFVYADTIGNIKFENNQLSYSLDGQKITGSRVPFVAYATATYEAEATTIKSTEFTLASSYVNVHLKDSQLANKNITGILISNTSNKVVLSAGGVVPPETTTESLHIKYDQSCGDKGYAMIAFAVPASAATSARKLNLTTSDKSYFTYFSASKLDPACFYSTALTTFSECHALKGVFTVNAYGKKVRFSPGNLYCTTKEDNSFDAFHFEANQYDYRHISNLSNDKAVINGESTTTPSKTVGSFKWGPIGEAILISIDDPSLDFFAAAEMTVDGESGWIALDAEGCSGEWDYLIYKRTMENGSPRYLCKDVNGVYGMILFPDDYPSSLVTEASWEQMEAAGCVFLPAAGYRAGSSVNDVGSYGNYWSSTTTSGDNDCAYYLYFYSGGVEVTGGGRYQGFSVRLVQKVSE